MLRSWEFVVLLKRGLPSKSCSWGRCGCHPIYALQATAPSPALRAPSPLVYKPGRWVTVFGDMGDTSIRTWKSSMEDNHALERGVGHVFALGVCGAGQSVEREYHPTVPAFWHQSGQR